MAATSALPTEFAPRTLARRTAEVVLLLAVVALIVTLAPGLGQVRDALAHASPGWMALALLLEFLSGVSYVLMFRPIFCRSMSWRTSWQISWSEMAAGSIVPASGAGGLALGAWVLHRRGMPSGHIARRSVAFFIIKSSVNFVAVAVVGIVALAGVGPDLSFWLTGFPAALAIVAIAAVLLLPRIGPGADPHPDAPKLARGWSVARRSVIGGVGEAVAIVRTKDPALLVGAVGYWAFDNAVLWATFKALGVDVPIIVILLGYLIGQLGGLLPIPGGVGGIDGGLIGTLIVYGAPVAGTAAAVLAYRVILFWLPLLVGTAAFWSLRRALDDPSSVSSAALR
ncbi:MAG TPA: lysylphosphatidylglycerol synthase transmembrane domain-containing protein [Solirubrobacteraceae bacterium]|nr:lysylphosphatidylglycerol synthase transmembrane domain-containing protein [Solirubrobacteraceae bacterium]